MNTVANALVSVRTVTSMEKRECKLRSFLFDVDFEKLNLRAKILCNLCGFSPVCQLECVAHTFLFLFEYLLEEHSTSPC